MTSRPQTESPPLFAATTYALATRILLLAISLGQGALLARGLGPAGLGRYSATLVDINLLVALLSLGLPGALALLAGESGAAEIAERLANLQRIAARHGLFVAAILALGLLAIFGGLPVPGRPPLFCALIAVAILIQYGRDITNALLWGKQRFMAQNRLNLLTQICLCAALLGLTLTRQLSPLAAILLQVGATLLWSLFARLFGDISPTLGTVANSMRSATDEPALAKRVRTIGLRNYLSQLLDLFLLRIDVYLIQELVPAATMERDLGLYQAGVRIAELCLMLPSTLNALLFVKAAAGEDIAEPTLRSAKLALWSSLVALGGMALVGKPLLVLFFGARFSGSFLPCLLVLAGCCALCFSGPLCGALSGAGGYPRSVLFAQTAALLCNLVANLYLLPRYGVIGAALASTLAYFTSSALLAMAFSRHYKIPLTQVLRIEAPWTLLRQIRQTGPT